MDGHIQFPQQQDGFEDRALMVIVVAVSIFGVDNGRFEQPDFIIPHKGLFVDSVHGCKLTDCEKFAFLIHSHLIK